MKGYKGRRKRNPFYAAYQRHEVGGSVPRFAEAVRLKEPKRKRKKGKKYKINYDENQHWRDK